MNILANCHTIARFGLIKGACYGIRVRCGIFEYVLELTSGISNWKSITCFQGLTVAV